MDLTKSAIQQLEVGFSTIYGDAFGQTPVWYNQISTTIPSSTATNTYGWMKTLPKMREWVGPRQIANLDTHAYTVENKHFELTVGVDANHIKDDQLGIYNPMFADLGNAAKKLPDQQLTSVIQNGTTALGFDGQAFFSSTHTLNPAGNQANNFTTTALTGPNFSTVRAAMMSYTDVNGVPLGVMPRLLIVPPQLEDTANTIVTAEYGASGSSNIQRGQAQVLTIPELANQGTTWYLADVSMAVKPLIWQNRESVRMVAMTDVTDSNVFMQRQFQWGIDGRGAASYALWFLMARAIA